MFTIRHVLNKVLIINMGLKLTHINGNSIVKLIVRGGIYDGYIL